MYMLDSVLVLPLCLGGWTNSSPLHISLQLIQFRHGYVPVICLLFSFWFCTYFRLNNSILYWCTPSKGCDGRCLKFWYLLVAVPKDVPMVGESIHKWYTWYFCVFSCLSNSIYMLCNNLLGITLSIKSLVIFWTVSGHLFSFCVMRLACVNWLKGSDVTIFLGWLLVKWRRVFLSVSFWYNSVVKESLCLY